MCIALFVKENVMAYVVPNSTIKLLRGVALDPSYQNEIYFVSSTAQYNYFNGKAKYTLGNYSYQRTGAGVIRVGLPEGGLHDCSYLMFQNTAYENKWFYAFITDTEYVNDNTSDVFFTIDEVQTWLFEMTLKPSMIERNHVTANEDTVGANINPEPVSIAEYVYDVPTYYQLADLSSCNVVIMVCDVEDATTYGTRYDGNFSGASLYAFNFSGDSSTVTPILNFLAQYSQRPDAILGIYLVPKYALPDSAIPSSHKLSNGQVGHSDQLSLNGVNSSTSFGSFTPKNKKLYTYPYNFAEVFNSSGQKMRLRYEFFDSLTPKVLIQSTLTNPVQVTVRPVGYKGYKWESGLGRREKFCDEYINDCNFPQCSWTNDYWSSWISQNALPLSVGTALAFMGVMAPAVQPEWEAALTPAGKVTQSKIKHFMQLDPDKQKHSKWFDYDTDSYDQMSENAVGAMPYAANALQQMYIASIHADQFRGNGNTNCCDVAHGMKGIYYHRAHIPEQQARMIDDYFEKYGYAIGRIGDVRRNVKSHWTYVKTQGCNITGNCPASSIAFVKKLYDRGITWWANGDEVGDYSLNNHS